ncbi:MAG: hypothetical protein AAGH83_10950 [Pseudomonadota bacterium]
MTDPAPESNDNVAAQAADNAPDLGDHRAKRDPKDCAATAWSEPSTTASGHVLPASRDTSSADDVHTAFGRLRAGDAHGAVAELTALWRAGYRPDETGPVLARALAKSAQAGEAKDKAAFLAFCDDWPGAALGLLPVDLARDFERLGLPDRALKLLDTHCARDPDSAPIFEMRAALLLRLGRIDAALDAAETLAARWPDRGRAFEVLRRYAALRGADALGATLKRLPNEGAVWAANDADGWVYIGSGRPADPPPDWKAGATSGAGCVPVPGGAFWRADILRALTRSGVLSQTQPPQPVLSGLQHLYAPLGSMPPLSGPVLVLGSGAVAQDLADLWHRERRTVRHAGEHGPPPVDADADTWRAYILDAGIALVHAVTPWGRVAAEALAGSRIPLLYAFAPSGPALTRDQIADLRVARGAAQSLHALSRRTSRVCEDVLGARPPVLGARSPVPA